MRLIDEWHFRNGFGLASFWHAAVTCRRVLSVRGVALIDWTPTLYRVEFARRLFITWPPGCWQWRAYAHRSDASGKWIAGVSLGRFAVWAVQGGC